MVTVEYFVADQDSSPFQECLEKLVTIHTRHMKEIYGKPPESY